MKTLQDKVAVITGAGSGIGRATALELARRGCHIAVCDINKSTAGETAKLVEALRRNASIHKVDVTKRAQMEALPAAVVKAHGAVQIVVNNAGSGVVAKLEDHSLEDFEWLVSLNLMGVVYGSKVFLDEMKRAGEGHIVNISSLAGFVAAPGISSYIATKFAVRGFSESIRMELAEHHIGVTSIHPGLIATNIPSAIKVTTAEMQQKQSGLIDAFAKFGRSPDAVAKKIADAIVHNKQRQLVGWETHMLEAGKRMFPVGQDRLTGWAAKLSAWNR